MGRHLAGLDFQPRGHQFAAEDALLERAALAVVDEVEKVVVALAQLHVDGPLPVPHGPCKEHGLPVCLHSI